MYLIIWIYGNHLQTEYAVFIYQIKNVRCYLHCFPNVYSLNENKYKLCYVMTLYFDEKDNSLLDHFDLAVKTVYISKNYTYHEENKLEKEKIIAV